MTEREMTGPEMTEIEFSRPIRISKMGKAGMEFSIVATPEECAALATRLNVVELKNLSASVSVTHWRKGGAHLVGKISGCVVQNCVVTLEDFEVPISEELELQFADPRDKILAPKIEEGEMILEVEGGDPPDVLEEDSLDVGEAIAQHLVLCLDAYPRRPGAEFEEITSNRQETSPFDVLSALKTSTNKDPDEG